jgi:hypothetical protein
MRRVRRRRPVAVAVVRVHRSTGEVPGALIVVGATVVVTFVVVAVAAPAPATKEGQKSTLGGPMPVCVTYVTVSIDGLWFGLADTMGNGRVRNERGKREQSGTETVMACITTAL